jgi:hypothetical protein
MQAPETTGHVYGCEICGRRGMTINELFAHKRKEHDPGFRLQVRGERQQYTHFPKFNDLGDVICPCCGHDDVAMWADDGEGDLADWWQCESFSGGCNSTGAVTKIDNPRLTQNGLPVPREENQ